MSIDELYQQIVSSNWLYVAIAVIAVLVIFLISRTVQKSNLNRRINEAQMKINDLKSHPFVVDIAKTDAIARANIKFRDTAEQCKQDFDRIQEMIKTSVDKLQDGSDSISTGNYKKSNHLIGEAEDLLNQAKENATKLDDVLSAVLNQSSLQRSRINELKTEFHGIKTTVNENSNDYIYCWEALDETTKAISHLFTEFEQMMDSSQYEEAAHKSDEINESINKLNETISTLPTLIRLARHEIPESLSQLTINYKLVLEYGPTLEHLNFDNTMIKMNNTLNDCLAKLKNCDIDQVNNRLLEIQAQVTALSQACDEEKDAFRQLQKLKSDCGDALKAVKEHIDRVDKDGSGTFHHYDLKELQDDFSTLRSQYFTCQNSYQTMVDTYQAKTVPSTTLLSTFNEVKKDIDACVEQCDRVCGKINECSVEEMRAKELISRFMVVLNEAKAAIRLSRLPSISSRYPRDIESAEQKVNALSKMLESSVLRMNDINHEIEICQNEVVSLYKNVNNLIETARDIENFIVLCNRYRPYYEEVDSALYSAELAYRNGEYTKACRITASALEKVDPKTARTLSESINRKLAMAKEA